MVGLDPDAGLIAAAVSSSLLSPAPRGQVGQVGLEPTAPDHQLEIRSAQELLKENAWATKQSSWHRRGWPRPRPSGQHLTKSK